MHSLVKGKFSWSHWFIVFVADADVGRSCILLTIGGKNLMLDCGMHMGYNDDVSNISKCVFMVMFLYMNKY